MILSTNKVAIIFLSFLHIANSQKNACDKLLAYPFAFLSPNCYHNPDVLSDAPSMVVRHGYGIEIHTLITEDGYILNLFRILSKEKNFTKSPVFIPHGLLSNSKPFVAISNRSLAFNLVDLGYDVWLGNLRGSTYSREHVTLNINDGEFWEFNLDDLTKYDIKEQLQYIANETGKGGSIIYIGHNLGTTLSFMLAAEFPDEAKNLIQGIIALAPMVYVKGSLHWTYVSPVIVLAHILGIKGVAYQETFIHKSAVSFCKLSPVACHWFLLFFFGKSKQILPDDIPIFFSNWLCGTSVAVTYQFYQNFVTDQFKKYDFGKKGNIEHYGTETPPFYDLGKVNLPVYLFYGKNDILTPQRNIDKLYNEIGSTVKNKQPVPRHNDTYSFNHIDFQYAKYVKEFLLEDLYSVMENYFQDQ